MGGETSEFVDLLSTYNSRLLVVEVVRSERFILKEK
jgi:hypothetical protein